MRSHHSERWTRSLGALLAVLTLVCSMFALGTSRAPAASAAPGDGSISGVVLDGNAQPIPDVTVEATGSLGYGVATTDAFGAYTISSLEDGSYTVSFSTNDGVYVGQQYDGVSSAGTPTPVDIVAGGAITGIDATMLRYGTISGTVTIADASPADGVSVSTIDPDGYSVMATTDVNGYYVLNSLAPGTYTVEFQPNDGIHHAQWWNGAANELAATTITVGDGGNVTGIDAVLSGGGSISGTILDSDAQPVDGATVSAEAGGSVYYSSSGPSGNYQFASLPPGSYRLYFGSVDGSLVAQYWNGKADYGSADLVEVVDGAAVTDISPVLQKTGTISGTVTDADGNPLFNVFVSADGSLGSAGSAQTAADGTYTISGLLADNYVVGFSSGAGYLPEYYDGASDYSGATSVTVATGAQVPGIDASLELGGTIDGTVTDSNGNPLADIYVYAWGETSGYGQALTNASGQYHLTGLPTDTYFVQFSDQTHAYATEYYTGAVEQLDATTVSVVAGNSSTGIDASLNDAATISGTVIGPDNLPVKSAQMSLLSTATGASLATAVSAADGTYTLAGLPAGEFKVRFGSPTPNLLDAYWNGATVEGDATPLTLIPGQVVPSINAKLLDAPTSISGLVTMQNLPSNISLSDVCAVLWSGSSQLRSSCSDYSGNFRMDDVAPGTYTVSYQDMLGVLPTTWFGGTATQSGSTPITVGIKEHFDASIVLIPTAHTISGSVYLEYGDPSSTTCVYLYHPGEAGTYAGKGTCTGASGTYLLSNVPDGDYVLAFVDPMGLKPTTWFSDTFYQGVTSQGAATTVTLDGTTSARTNVNVSMDPASGTIIGRVMDRNNMLPLANICLYAFDWNTATNSVAASTSAATCTNSQGGYVLSGLSLSGSARYQVAMVDPSGEYPTMWAAAYTYSPSVSFDAQSRPTATSAFRLGAYPYGIANMAVTPGGSISGTVHDQATGLPRSGACVYVDFAADGTYVGLGAQTDALGHYTLPNLAPGSAGLGYKVGFYTDCSPGQPPTTHWNGGASSEAAASSVTVFAGSNSGGVDATF